MVKCGVCCVNVDARVLEMERKPRVMICDDSKHERMRFYARQFDNFEILGVERIHGEFVEKVILDSPQALYQEVLKRRNTGDLPDLVLLDLFYKKDPKVDGLEEAVVADIVAFKSRFLSLREQVLSYQTPSGMDVLRRIRKVDRISKEELPIMVYTDKDFNFLPPADFNELYELDPGFVYKDRDDPNLRVTIPVSAEYFRIMSAIDLSRVHKEKQRVFLTHGHRDDWCHVQKFIETELFVPTIEFNQVAYRGNTIIQHLSALAERCSCAVIVMTGEDAVEEGELRSRENVIHELGFFQGRFGIDRVVILHEGGTHVPSNLQGIIYIAYDQGAIVDVFSRLARELAAAGVLGRPHLESTIK